MGSNVLHSGKVVWDNYEGNVLGKFNTWNRINTEYRKKVDVQRTRR